MAKSSQCRSVASFGTAAAVLSSLSFCASASAGWEVPAEPQARAEIAYTDGGKTPFDLLCGHNIVLYLSYPGKKKSGTATIVISTAKTSITIHGDLEKSDAGNLQFVAAWTGKTRDPADQDALMAMFSSGLEMTLRAEGASYVLPGIDAEPLAKYNNAY